MILENFLFVASISLLGMISPGPDFFLVVKNSLSYPRKYAFMTCFGVVMAIFTHMIYCVAGIAVIITATPWLYTFLRYAGALYLIWLGIKAIIAKPGGGVYISHSDKLLNITYKKVFMQGYLCNLLNPKATLFFLSIFTQVVAIDSTLQDKLYTASIICAEAIIWWPVVVIIFQSPMAQRFYSKMQFFVDKLLGLILIALGVKVALGI
ncbi:LysE family translocator [Orbaceae bacterium ac157xtp]